MKKFTQILPLEFFPLGEALVEVFGTYTPALPEKVSGPPEYYSPGEPAELEVASLKLVANADGKPISPIDLTPWLTPKAFEDLEWLLLEKLCEPNDYTED